jgi:hypothetical protein
MITYRVTVAIPTHILDEWLSWMLEHHIPDVVATGCFCGHHIRRVLDTAHENTTIVIDYQAASLDAYHTYASTHAPALQQQHTNRYGALVTASRQILTDDLHAP